MNKKIIFFLSFFILFFVNSNSFSETLKNYKIVGNKRILDETIIEYAKFIKNKDYSSDELNTMQKKIFETGFFQKIKIYTENSILIIDVVENPIINFYNIQGELDNDNLNKLYDSLKLGPNKIYTESSLKNDLEFIKKYYFQLGYLDSTVTTRLVEIDSSKVNIIITINKNDKTKINRIYFIGDKKYSNSDLINIINSSEHGWWKFLSTNTLVNYDRIEYDKKLIKDFYLNNGYYDAQISSAEVVKTNDKANITFSINSGTLFYFGKTEIVTGENLINNSVKEYIELSKKKLLKKNYSKKNINKFVDDLNDFLSKSKIDFIFASINEKKNNKNIDISLNFTPTNKNYINNILVSGNSLTKEEVIRRNLNFNEGDSYSDYKRKKALDKLKSLNIFNDVQITTTNSSNDGKVDVDIKVSDKPTGTLSAGAGYGSSVGAMINFGMQEKNFLGNGISVNTNLNIGTQVIEGSVGLVVPDFQYTDRSLISKLYSTKTTFNNTLYESKKTGIELATHYELFSDISLRPGVGIDYDKVDVLPNASNYMKSQDGNYLTNKITYNLEADFRETKVSTRQGFVSGFGQELAYLGSDIPYIKSSIYGSNYYPISEKQTFNLKYGYSNITSLNNKDIKLSDRLFAPYQYSKGFEPRGIGPKDSNSSEFIGGNNTFYGLASATVPNPFQESFNINTVTFINAFNVWGTDTSSSIIDNNSIRSAIGIGIDWTSPLGPINLSFAKPINKESTDKTKTFSIDIGTVF